jgi:uncharacterized membrane protein YeaQ/YmgE (transglycosylase-associated protein family)
MIFLRASSVIGPSWDLGGDIRVFSTMLGIAGAVVGGTIGNYFGMSEAPASHQSSSRLSTILRRSSIA